MIVIVSSTMREATLFASLCDHRKWPCQPCSTIGQLMTLSEQAAPYALVVRHRLQDGYSDDVFRFLETAQLSLRPRVIVLMPADSTGKAEARQIALGADCVLRDPVRIEVLFEYLARYRLRKDAETNLPAARPTYKVADAEIFPREHRIAYGERSFHLAPQEVALLRILSRSDGTVVTYTALYDELLNRKFSGDTTNCRVLLGKVCSSYKRLGIDLKRFVRVIPKSGYLYSATPADSPEREASPAAKHRKIRP